MATGEKVGIVTNYFARMGVAVIQLTDADLRLGDLIRICGYTTDFTQPVASLQIEHRPVTRVEQGGRVALKVGERVRRGDQVFRVRESDWPSGIVPEL